ncbi:hypothetical protein CPC08DRAFT_821536 [Agrocybe pediades]|nr:hypothetical protein CPC08DRAFT_821536 [Agrocybe pediades]
MAPIDPSEALLLAVNVPETLGALSIGALVSILFFGICTLQMYMYFLTFPADRLYYKALVGFIWLGELAHSICVCYFMYNWTIVQYGNPISLIGRPPAALTATILIGAFVGPPTQIFFAERVRLVSEGRLLVPLICWSASLTLFGMEIFLYVQGERSVSLADFQSKWRWIITAILALSTAVDVLEALSLCYYLDKLRRLSMGRTAVNIHTIMRLTMETGLLKSMSEVSMLLCFLFMPHNFVWLAIYICLTRFHSNSLLASLNSRAVLRQFNIKAAAQTSPPGSTEALTRFTDPVFSV